MTLKTKTVLKEVIEKFEKTTDHYIYLFSFVLLEIRVSYLSFSCLISN